jgi:putative hydrolase of the HAD superfamily
MRICDRFSVILFDMNETFMFGGDRFGKDEDFYLTYRELCGGGLSSDDVNLSIRQCFDEMYRIYKDPRRMDSFISVAEAIRSLAAVPSQSVQEIESLVSVFAEHEVGRIPESYAEFFCELSLTKKLGVVSNIWAPKSRWLQEFRRTGIDQAFGSLVFSSDGRSIKPSRRLFLDAMAALEASPEETLFVGDSLDLDIAPARDLGMRTAWITPNVIHAREIISPDYVLPTILALNTAG